MAQVKTLQVTGRAYGGQPASQPQDFVRYQEFSGTLSSKANTVHRHDASDIDGLIPMLMQLAGEALHESQSIIWIISGSQLSSAQVRLQANGGLTVNDEGLAVNPGSVSVPGHHHVAADINDFAAALFSQLELLYATSSTMEWSFDGGLISGTVRLKPAGGVLETPDGVALDFGTGTNQAARGDHTHAQLHNSGTLGPSNSLALTLTDQRLVGEVRLGTTPALLIDGTGLRVDLGSGTNQAARGTHSHALLHNPVTVVNDAALHLVINASQQLSGTVVRDLAPPGGFGKIALGVAGLSVELGTASDEAAAGNHGHDLATESVAGFLSPTDKTRLDVLWATGPSGTGLPQSGTMDSLHVRVLYLVNPNTGQTRAIYLGDDGHVKGLGSGTL